MSSLQLNIQTQAQALVSLCIEKNVTFGTAESCTGGLISASVTNISGASAAFFGGIVSYDNSVKAGVLGVQEETLSVYGPVSEETAREMSCGARRVLGVDFAVSVTGYAGPAGGGTEDKPVGLVYISVSSDKKTLVTKNLFSGDREAVRLQAVSKALALLTAEIHSI